MSPYKLLLLENPFSETRVGTNGAAAQTLGDWVVAPKVPLVACG